MDTKILDIIIEFSFILNYFVIFQIKDMCKVNIILEYENTALYSNANINVYI